ncbi:MAG: hypothetical protein AAF696_06605 [Bacteroidota bacterium]
MKISKLLYLAIIPLLINPSLNASKDVFADINDTSVYLEQMYPDRACARELRRCEIDNRYLEKELLVMEDELTRARRKIKRMQQRIQDYEYELSLYKNRNPRRPRAHGYDTPSSYQGKGKARSPRKPRNY